MAAPAKAASVPGWPASLGTGSSHPQCPMRAAAAVLTGRHFGPLLPPSPPSHSQLRSKLCLRPAAAASARELEVPSQEAWGLLNGSVRAVVPEDVTALLQHGGVSNGTTPSLLSLEHQQQLHRNTPATSAPHQEASAAHFQVQREACIRSKAQMCEAQSLEELLHVCVHAEQQLCSSIEELDGTSPSQCHVALSRYLRSVAPTAAKCFTALLASPRQSSPRRAPASNTSSSNATSADSARKETVRRLCSLLSSWVLGVPHLTPPPFMPQQGAEQQQQQQHGQQQGMAASGAHLQGTQGSRERGTASEPLRYPARVAAQVLHALGRGAHAAGPGCVAPAATAALARRLVGAQVEQGQPEQQQQPLAALGSASNDEGSSSRPVSLTPGEFVNAAWSLAVTGAHHLTAGSSTPGGHAAAAVKGPQGRSRATGAGATLLARTLDWLYSSSCLLMPGLTPQALVKLVWALATLSERPAATQGSSSSSKAKPGGKQQGSATTGSSSRRGPGMEWWAVLEAATSASSTERGQQQPAAAAAALAPEFLAGGRRLCLLARMTLKDLCLLTWSVAQLQQASAQPSDASQARLQQSPFISGTCHSQPCERGTCSTIAPSTATSSPGPSPAWLQQLVGQIERAVAEGQVGMPRAAAPANAASLSYNNTTSRTGRGIQQGPIIAETGRPASPLLPQSRAASGLSPSHVAMLMSGLQLLGQSLPPGLTARLLARQGGGASGGDGSTDVQASRGMQQQHSAAMPMQHHTPAAPALEHSRALLPASIMSAVSNPNISPGTPHISSQGLLGHTLPSHLSSPAHVLHLRQQQQHLLAAPARPVQSHTSSSQGTSLSEHPAGVQPLPIPQLQQVLSSAAALKQDLPTPQLEALAESFAHQASKCSDAQLLSIAKALYRLGLGRPVGSTATGAGSRASGTCSSSGTVVGESAFRGLVSVWLEEFHARRHSLLPIHMVQLLELIHDWGISPGAPWLTDLVSSVTGPALTKYGRARVLGLLECLVALGVRLEVPTAGGGNSQPQAVSSGSRASRRPHGGSSCEGGASVPNSITQQHSSGATSPTGTPSREVVLAGQTKWLKGVLRSLTRESKHAHMAPAQLARLQAAVRALTGLPATGGDAAPMSASSPALQQLESVLQQVVTRLRPPAASPAAVQPPTASAACKSGLARAQAVKVQARPVSKASQGKPPVTSRTTKQQLRHPDQAPAETPVASASEDSIAVEQQTSGKHHVEGGGAHAAQSGHVCQEEGALQAGSVVGPLLLDAGLSVDMQMTPRKRAGVLTTV